MTSKTNFKNSGERDSIGNRFWSFSLDLLGGIILFLLPFLLVNALCWFLALPFENPITFQVIGAYLAWICGLAGPVLSESLGSLRMPIRVGYALAMLYTYFFLSNWVWVGIG